MATQTQVAVEIVKKIYKTSGPVYSAKDAAVIGPALEQVNRDTPSGILPENVVDAARPETSPLHPFFEWNDRIAAQSYRLEQARHMLRNIVVEVTLRHPTGREETREWRAFFNVNVAEKATVGDSDAESEPTQRRYVDVVTVANTPDYKQQVVEKAEAELRGWSKRYSEYQALPEFVRRLGPVISAIDALSTEKE